MGRKTVGRFVLNSTTPILLNANSNVIFTNSTISTNALSYNSSTGEIQIRMPGLYMVYANFTTTATTGEETATINMLENGIAVPGASASETLEDTGDIGSLAFTAITTVNKTCNDGSFATLAFRNLDTASYTVANVIVEKIA